MQDSMIVKNIHITHVYICTYNERGMQMQSLKSECKKKDPGIMSRYQLYKENVSVYVPVPLEPTL